MTRAPKIDPARVEQHFSRIGNTATAQQLLDGLALFRFLPAKNKWPEKIRP